MKPLFYTPIFNITEKIKDIKKILISFKRLDKVLYIETAPGLMRAITNEEFDLVVNKNLFIQIDDAFFVKMGGKSLDSFEDRRRILRKYIRDIFIEDELIDLAKSFLDKKVFTKSKSKTGRHWNEKHEHLYSVIKIVIKDLDAIVKKIPATKIAEHININSSNYSVLLEKAGNPSHDSILRHVRTYLRSLKK